MKKVRRVLGSLEADQLHIQNYLRKATITWSGRRDALRSARRRVRSGGKTKLHWQCASCLQWFRDEKEVEVDHIVGIGPFNGSWDDYISRMFRRPVSESLQVLCISCHARKTGLYNSARSRWVRKVPVDGEPSGA